MEKCGRLNRTLSHGLIFILCALLGFSLLPILPVYAEADNPKTIKVGSFLYDGYLDVGNDGSYTGYAYDYLQEIAQYTNWRYEFVDAGWDESLAMLEKGELDLMGIVMKSPEREKIFDFSSLPMQSGYGVLVTRLDNETLPYEDFQAFNGLSVGVMKGNQQAESFLKYSREQNFTTRLTYYETQAELDEALDRGELDAMIMTSVLCSDQLRVVAKFGENDCYFVTGKGNNEVLDELNNAMKQIQFKNLYFNTELNYKYFDLAAVTPISFTRQEMDYIKAAGPIRCAYNPAARPISYYDTTTKTVQGIVSDVCTLLEKKTGLTFEYVHTKTYADAVDLFERKQVELLVGKTHDFGWAQENNATLTTAFLDGQMVMVSNGKDIEKPIIALYDKIYTNKLITDMIGQAAEVKYYTTVNDCMDAVKDGEADRTFINSTIMSFQINNPKYSSLQVTQLYGCPANTCIAVTGNCDPALISILNKALGTISNTQLNQIVSSNMKVDYFNSFVDFIYARPFDFILLFTGIMVLISFIFFLLIHNRIKNADTMRRMLYTDALTGDPNYTALIEAAPGLLGTHPEHYALLYMDMRQFKYINDTMGYVAGDKLLCAISAILNSFINKEERFARVYADKFVLLLQFDETEAFRRRLDDLSARLLKLSSGEFDHNNFVFSCGVYQFKEDGCTVDVACDRANYAKGTIHNTFSNTFSFYDDLIRSQILSEKALESSMKAALENGEFIPYFQPKVNIITGEVIGAEALVRWKHPEKGILSPASFLPFFEKNGFIVNIDFFMFENVCQVLREWIDAGIKPVPISVNFSRHHMLDHDFVKKLQAMTDRFLIPPHLLEIEITETIALDDLGLAVGFSNSLKECGFLISIDDYGTGYSSISFLQKLPLDVLKLDKSFIENAMQSKKAGDIMRHLVTAVRDNQIRVLCEGIETAEQREFMLSQGCCFAQGFLYAKPLPKNEFEAYIKNSNTSNVLR